MASTWSVTALGIMEQSQVQQGMKSTLSTKDWLWVLSVVVGATFGLVVYAQNNFMSKDDKMNIKDDIAEIKSQLIHLNDKLDHVVERISNR